MQIDPNCVNLSIYSQKHGNYVDIRFSQEHKDYVPFHISETSQQLYYSIFNKLQSIAESQLYYWWWKKNKFNLKYDKNEIIWLRLYIQ